MDFKEVMENARKCLGKCKGCPVCNGIACRNTIPGPGAKGVGDTAIRNYAKWQDIRVVMDTLCEKRPVDTSIELFGRTFKYPIFAGPVGAVAMHYSDKYNDVTYNAELVPGCADAGIAAFTGDGMDPQVMQGATDAIKACGGGSHGEALERPDDRGKDGTGETIRCLCGGHGRGCGRTAFPEEFRAPCGEQIRG